MKSKVDDMENNRIQKLILSEYCDLSDTVLIESPFAQTTRDGRGLREVALGLTTSKLIVAADILRKNCEFSCPPDLDPSIESFELVSIFPLACVSLSVFRRRRRRTLKARLIDGRANYYELGGMERRGLIWTLWCERIQQMVAEKGAGSSLPETTAASSSSASSMYLLSTEVEADGRLKSEGDKSACRVWMHYGGGGDGIAPPSWPRKDLFMGPGYDQLSYGYYTPVPVRFAGASLDDLRYELNDQSPCQSVMRKGCQSWSGGRNFRGRSKNQKSGGLCDVLFTRDKNLRQCSDNFGPGFLRGRRPSHRNEDVDWTNEMVAERGEPGCHIRNFEQQSPRETSTKNLPGVYGDGNRERKNLTLVPKLSRFGFGVQENCSSGLYLSPYEVRTVYKLLDPDKLSESGVAMWEGDANKNDEGLPRRKSGRHPRRYGLATAAHFLHALGPWSVQPGERESVQGRRALSAVGVRRQPADPELRLPVSRRQLAATVSTNALGSGSCDVTGAATRSRVVLFWTPEYWYRPRAAPAAYKELRQHLHRLREFRAAKEKNTAHGGNLRRFFSRSKLNFQRPNDIGSEDRPSRILDRIFSSNANGENGGRCKKNQDNGGRTTGQLRQLLRMDLRVSAWDLDSTTIARQLTLLDRDLFLHIPTSEMEIVVVQRSSRNAPNLGAWIAFSHRISCLMSSEILNAKRLESRARLIARIINAAAKCHAGGNFHSCRSLLAGLQSPAIYRLKTTWKYLRVHHATKYQSMEGLCKIYTSPRTKRYKKMWLRAEGDPPCLPYVGDILTRLLDISRANLRSPTRIITSGKKSSMDSRSRDRITEPQENRSPAATCVERKSRGIGFSRRILSGAIFKFGTTKTTLSRDDEASIKNLRYRIRARMACERWRRYVANARIARAKCAVTTEMEERCKRITEVAHWLVECQRSAQNYAYPGHSLAWEFLLKARYKEERENFFTSLKLESTPVSV